MIYTEYSSICSSAIHAGFSDGLTPSEFIVVIANGEPQYEGSI